MGNVIERMISRDYLFVTRNGPPPSWWSVTSTIGDFFDRGSLPDYKNLLRNRHPLEVDRKELGARRDIKIPDISTWQGDFRERVAGVSITGNHDPGTRNEHYEVKPDNDGGRYKGITKLDAIGKNNVDLKLTARLLGAGYNRGTWYPSEAREIPARPRRIHFTDSALRLRSFLFRLNRWTATTKALGLTMVVEDIYIEVKRRRPGLLEYRLCIEMLFDDDATDTFQRSIWAKVCRLLYEHLLAPATELDLRFLNSLVPIGKRSGPPGTPDPNVATAEAALTKADRFETTIVHLVEEIKPLYEQLRATLLTRCRGMPGDVFIVASDEAYFQQEVVEQRKQIVQQRARLLSSLYGGTTSSFPSGIAITRLATLTLDEAARSLGAEARRFAADPVQWVRAHERDVLTAVAVMVVVTAVTCLIFLTAGAGAPLALPAGGVALANVATTGVAVESGVVTGATVAVTVAPEAGAAAVGSGVLAQAPSAGLVMQGGMTATEVAALRFGIGMSQGMARAGLGTELATEAALEDAIVFGARSGASGATNISALNANMLAGAVAGQTMREHQVAFRDLIEAKATTYWRDAIMAGGPSVAALSSRQIIAKPRQPGAGPSALTLGLGKLYLLKARSLATLSSLPPLEGDFDWSKHTDDLASGSDAPKRLRYLGVIRCRQ